MYFVDTNVWIERLLDQSRSDEVGFRGEIRRVQEGHGVTRREIREFRDETAAAHQDLRASITFVYGDLDCRVWILEGNR